MKTEAEHGLCDENVNTHNAVTDSNMVPRCCHSNRDYTPSGASVDLFSINQPLCTSCTVCFLPSRKLWVVGLLNQHHQQNKLLQHFQTGLCCSTFMCFRFYLFFCTFVLWFVYRILNFI